MYKHLLQIRFLYLFMEGQDHTQLFEAERVQQDVLISNP